MLSPSVLIRGHDGCDYRAEFTPVRRVKSLTLGWAVVRDTDAGDLRFPAIRDVRHDRFLTVADWQGPWQDTDLSDAVDYNTMVQTGAGRFLTSSGNESNVGWVFILWMTEAEQATIRAIFSRVKPQLWT